MTEYFPDRWVLIKITHPHETIYKVLGTWFGGFVEPDTCRLNSGIVRVEYKNGKYLFYGYSGSVYHCHEDDYGTTLYSSSALNEWIDKVGNIVEILPKEADPITLIANVVANE